MSEAARAELDVKDTLRVGVAVGPPNSAFWTTGDGPGGAPKGVAVDLGHALAQALGVKAQIVPFKSSGAIMDALAANSWDVAFMPVDDERKQKVDFTPNYALGESTFMVAPSCDVKSIDAIDRAGIRVVGVDNTTTIRAARRLLKNASVVGAVGANDTLALLRSGGADAIALGRDTLELFARETPGARVLDGHFWAVGVALAVRKGKPALLAAASDFIERAKSDGAIRRAYDAAGLKKLDVPPVGSRS